MKLKILVLLNFLNLAFTVEMAGRERDKRWILVYPPTSPTRHQLISGIGIPIPYNSESVTLGWTLKCQYFMPETVDMLKPAFAPDFFVNYSTVNPLGFQKFPFAEFTRNKRDLAVTEVYNVDAKVVGDEELKSETSEDSEDDEEFDDQFEDEKDGYIDPYLQERYHNSVLDETGYNKVKQKEDENGADKSYVRWATYEGLGRILNSKGFNGRSCVLKSICESAETNFASESGLLGELMHIVFTPSSTNEDIQHPAYYDYIKAEELGRKGEPCSEIFKDCDLNILEAFTKILE